MPINTNNTKNQHDHRNRPADLIEDAGNQTVYGAMEFQSHSSAGQQYGYDDNGSLVWDANKQIAHITYDNLNYPKEVQFTNGNRIQYVYSPDGQKLRATWQTAVANIVVPLDSTTNLSNSQISSTTRTDYIGNVIYTGTASSYSTGVSLSKYLFEGGYATVTPSTQPVFHYFTQDYLGNNRAVMNQSGTVEQITHYYPFGGIFADQGTGSSLQPYKYNGKELDRMHGLDLYDYGARQYDAVVPMFTQQDPMAEKYYHLSPYVYCGNNPVKYIDKDGKGPIIGAIVGGLIDYAAQVTTNVVEKGELSLDSFTKDIDMGSIATSMLEGAATSGASSLKAAAKIAKVTSTITKVGTNNDGELDISLKTSDEVLVGVVSDKIGNSTKKIANKFSELPTKKEFTSKQKVKAELRSKGKQDNSINEKARQIANKRNAKAEKFNQTTGKVNAKINKIGSNVHNYTGKMTTDLLNKEYEEK